MVKFIWLLQLVIHFLISGSGWMLDPLPPILVQARCITNPNYNGFPLQITPASSSIDSNSNSSSSSSDGVSVSSPSLSSSSICLPGWYCPQLDLGNTTTWPVVCPPTRKCNQRRLASEFCDAQGEFEPSPCPKGFYCPTPTSKIVCPEGHWCYLGSVAPTKCSSMSVCPEGTANEYQWPEALLFLLCCDSLLLGVVLSYRSFYGKSKAQEPSPQPSATTTPQKKSDRSASLFDLIQQARVPSSSSRQEEEDDKFTCHQSPSTLSFDFKNLSVRVPGVGTTANTNASSSSKEEEPQTPATPVDGTSHKSSSGEKILLRGVTGSFRPGTVTAIMGPSGAGKTVLLSTILGRISSSWKQEGDLNVCVSNGSDISKQVLRSEVRHAIGFVPQDDNGLHSDLTVLQNLYFSSETRLPHHLNQDQKKDVRDEVLKALDLDHVKHVKIGDPSERGVSGGQRKRCSVGVEMAAAPTALFLDEPTTGLDAATALDLCDLLKQLARLTETTVAMVVHQPRVEIWEALDDILLLAPGGRTVYQGPQSEAVDYFRDQFGLSFEWGNPADVLLDGIALFGDEAADLWEQRSERDEQRGQEQRESGESGNEKGSSESPAPPLSLLLPQNASFVRQISLSHQRALLKVNASLFALIFDIIMASAAAVVMGTAVLREDFIGLVIEGPYIVFSPRPRLFTTPMLGMFYMIALASATTPSGVRSFGSQLPQYWREASNGYSKLAFYIGTSIVDIYRSFYTALHFSFFAYLMWEPLMTFWELLGILLLANLCVNSQAVALSMWLLPETAPMFATVIGVFMGLLNGYPGIPVVNPISYAWWTTEFIVAQNWNQLTNIFQTQVFTDNFDYRFSRTELDVVMLVIYFLLYRLIGFLLLVVLNREKQR